MKSKNVLCRLSIAIALQSAMLASSAQTNKYLFSGSETNITLNPGTYIINCRGAAGGSGGGGGSIIDSSAIAILAEVSGIASPDDYFNGEIIITAVPTPLFITTHAAFGFTNGVFGFNVIGPSGYNVVIQASTDLQTWSPLQTNVLGSGLLHFSDARSPSNVRRFYRTQLSP